VIVALGEVGGEILGFAGEFFERLADWVGRWREWMHLDLGALGEGVGWVQDYYATFNAATIRHYGTYQARGSFQTEPNRIIARCRGGVCGIN
jgi:hypothetical protein